MKYSYNLEILFQCAKSLRHYIKNMYLPQKRYGSIDKLLV